MSDETPIDLARVTTTELAALVARGNVVAIVPAGSVEPHGPHLPLGTDTMLGEESAKRAARALRERGTMAFVAPSVPYGVTEYARGFTGAVGIEENVLTDLLASIGRAFVREGFAHVCFVSHHLEPAHDAAVRAVIARLPEGRASVASPLTRKWGAVLSAEYKSGACHAGEYETSLVMAAGERVRDEVWALPDLTISLSEGIRAGKKTFVELGMDRAYTGAPARASREEGDALYEKHVAMIVGEIEAALGRVVATPA